MSVVAIVYHSFAHYREAIIKELVSEGENEYVFVADVEDRNAGIKPVSLPEGATFLHAPCRHVWRNIMFQRGLVRLALRRDIDCIIYFGNAAWPSTWLSAILSRLTRKRVLFWTHGWRKRDLGLKKLIRVTFYRLAHGLLLYGDRARDIALENGFDRESTYVVYNSLDYERQKKLRDEIDSALVSYTRSRLFDNPDLPQIIFSGRLIESKRVDLLLRASKLLADQGKPVNVLVVGSGPCLTELEQVAAYTGVNAHFYGASYTEDEIAPLIASSDLAVSPGPVGLSAMHALAYGIPIVVSSNPEENGPEWEAVVKGVNGDHFEGESASSLADAIGRNMHHSASREFRANCSDVIDRFFNPIYQRSVIEAAVSGTDANTFPGQVAPGTYSPQLTLSSDKAPQIDRDAA